MPLGFRTADGGLELEAAERAARRMIRAELNVALLHRRQVQSSKIIISLIELCLHKAVFNAV